MITITFFVWVYKLGRTAGEVLGTASPLQQAELDRVKV